MTLSPAPWQLTITMTTTRRNHKRTKERRWFFCKKFSIHLNKKHDYTSPCFYYQFPSLNLPCIYNFPTLTGWKVCEPCSCFSILWQLNEACTAWNSLLISYIGFLISNRERPHFWDTDFAGNNFLNNNLKDDFNMLKYSFFKTQVSVTQQKKIWLCSSLVSYLFFFICIIYPFFDS